MKLSTLVLLAAPCALAVDPDVYSVVPTTEKGCKCSGPCSTGAFFKCNAAAYCHVKDKNCAKGTAEWSPTAGHYDYCTYELDAKYESLSAAKKKTILLSKVNADKHGGKFPSTVRVLTGIMGESVRLSFESSSDVFPEERTKYIHSVGVTGGIKFVSSGGHPYTGLFEGAEHGIVRFSSAKQPGSGGIAPGMGVKFLRDGRPSANFVSMYSLDGQPCSDKGFFEHEWSNHIPTTDNFGLKLIAKKFWQASYCPLMVGLSDLASGSDASAGTFPFRLHFKPLHNVDCDCNDYASCLANLESIPVGTEIFSVSAEANAPSSEAVVIGKVILTDALSRSTFGDNELFFKHQYMEDDFKLRPEWLKAIDPLKECNMKGVGTTPPSVAMGCTSPFGSNGFLNSNASSSGMLANDVPITV